MPDPPAHTDPDKPREFTPLEDIQPSQMVSTISGITTTLDSPNSSQGLGALRSSPIFKGSSFPYNKAKRKTRTNSFSSIGSADLPGNRAKGFGGDDSGIRSWSEAVTQEEGQCPREGPCPVADIQDFTNPSLYPSTAASTQIQQSNSLPEFRPGSVTPTRASNAPFVQTQASSTHTSNIQFFWETGECGDFVPDEEGVKELLQGCERAHSVTYQLLSNAAKNSQIEYKNHLSTIIDQTIAFTEGFLENLYELQNLQEVVPSSQEHEDCDMQEIGSRGNDVMETATSEQLRLEHSIHAPGRENSNSSESPSETSRVTTQQIPETSDPVTKFLIEQLLKMGDRLDKLEGRQSAGVAPVRAPNSIAPTTRRATGLVPAPAPTQTATALTEAGPTPMEASRLPNPPKKSYASTITNALRNGNKAKPISQAPKVNSPNQANVKVKTPTEVRMVLRVQGGMPKEKRLPSFQIKREVESILNKRAGTEKARLLEAHWNISGNLVMLFSPSTNPNNIFNVEDEIKRALKVTAPSTLMRDVPWSKVVLANIPTGIHDILGNRQPWSEETILDELLRSDFFRRVKITQTPKWLSPAEKIDKYVASLSVAFEDPDGSLLRQLRGEKIFMFGNAVRIKRWNDKPLLKVCGKCLSYDHDQANCKMPARCQQDAIVALTPTPPINTTPNVKNASTRADPLATGANTRTIAGCAKATILSILRRA